MAIPTAQVPPNEIKESLEQFRRDHMDSSKVAFLIMKFGSTEMHSEIVTSVKNTLAKNNIIGVRADEKEYHDILYYNVLTYLHGCHFGVAIFERLSDDYFNPNVSLETGYMLALGKNVCLLKDRTIRALQTDLVGKMYREFDQLKSEETVGQVLTSWMLDKQIIIPGQRKHPVRVSTSRRTIGRDEKQRNFNELRFLKHSDRRVEIDLFKSDAQLGLSVLHVSFVFGIRNAHVYVQDRWQSLIRELLGDGSLVQHTGVSWLRRTESIHRYEGWCIDGEALRNEFPELDEFDWLRREFQCSATFVNFPHEDEPRESFRVVFQLGEEE
jgi:hypothetical protein